MTPQQRTALLASAKRLGWIASLAIPALGWGFKQYDRTNVSSSDFRDHVERVRLDSAARTFEYRELRGTQLRTDSAVQKLCVRLKAGC